MPEVDAVRKEAEAVMGRRGKVSQREKEACQGQAGTDLGTRERSYLFRYFQELI